MTFLDSTSIVSDKQLGRSDIGTMTATVDIERQALILDWVQDGRAMSAMMDRKCLEQLASAIPETLRLFDRDR